jgi:hypothetical protein
MLRASLDGCKAHETCLDASGISISCAGWLACLQVRNQRGRELLESVGARLETTPTMSTGDRRQLVLQTAIADDTAKLGEAPDPMPRWLGNILAWVVEKVCPLYL